MGEYKNSAKKIAIIFGITSIILAALVVLTFTNTIPTMNSNRAAKLVNVGLGARDLGQDPPEYVRSVRVDGYVCNVGIETAYKTKLHVVANYVTGGVALDQYITIGDGGIIYGGESARIFLDIPYAGDTDIGNIILTPEWNDSP